MKVINYILNFRVAALLLTHLPVSEAIKCGRPLTTACLGDTDIRYDPKSSNAAADQAPVWPKLAGLFRGDGQVRVNILDPLVLPVPATPDSAVVALPFVDFINVTVDASGTRQTLHSFFIFGTGFFERAVFGTTTHEKDGSMISLPSIVSQDGATAPNPVGAAIYSGASFQSRSYPVDENTVYITTPFSPAGNEKGVHSVTRVCLDAKCNQMQSSTNSFEQLPNGTVFREAAFEALYIRVKSAEEWKNGILDSYDTYNTNVSERVSPDEYICSKEGFCPSEEQWCQSDPNCDPSPYEEPSASVKPGAIAGFVILGIAVLVLALYALHRYSAAKQAERYRTIFAKRIAETIQVRGSVRSMNPAALAAEFERIDSDVKDGKLSKEELWNFISSGKAGDMDKHDFDALFAAIDLDKNGTVDFLEFCAFMGNCHDEYREARIERGSVVAKSSRRLEASAVTARRLSSMPEVGNAVGAAAAAAKIEEGEDSEEEELK